MSYHLLMLSNDLLYPYDGYVTNYPPPTPNTNEVTLEQSGCDFILALIRFFLFANKKGLHVYSYFLPL